MNSMQTQRMNRVKEGVQTYVNGDKLLFVFAKSNNDNCIIFMYDEEDGIVPMWLHLEPKDVEKHKKSGNLSMMSSQLTTLPACLNMSSICPSVVLNDRLPTNSFVAIGVVVISFCCGRRPQ